MSLTKEDKKIISHICRNAVRQLSWQPPLWAWILFAMIALHSCKLP